MSKLIAKCCIAVAVLSSVVACAAPSGDYRMHSCREDNRRTHAEVMEMFHRAHSAGRISPSEAQQFSAMEGRLNRHRDMLARDGLTPQECQYLSRELANERAMVQRMAASPAHDSRLHSCREDNRRTHAEVMEMFHRAHSAGRISPSEAQQFSAMEGRLNRHRDMLARDGLTPQECQYLSRELANERAIVQRMAASPAHDPRLHQCRLDNQRAHGEVMGMFHRARSAGRISPAEAQHFRAMEGRMNNHRAALAQDGLTLQECQHLGREIARERNEVQRMTFSPR